MHICFLFLSKHRCYEETTGWNTTNKKGPPKLAALNIKD